MISEEDKAMIVNIARRYDVKGVLLFGSSIDPNRAANDIDLAIEGIAPAKFFLLCPNRLTLSSFQETVNLTG